MLDEKDIQTIGDLLDQKLDQKFKENNKILKDEIVSEIGEITNEAFSSVERRLEKVENKVDDLSKEMAKRPTKTEMFSWADERIIDLEIAKERHDYLHINELDKLPSRSEINRALIEHGQKKKLA